MRIAKWYKLHKDGEFYFLYRDRGSFLPNDHATKLSSALRKLSKSSIPGSANVKVELADETVSVPSPVSKNEETVEKVAQEGENLAQTDSMSIQSEDKVVPVCDSVVPKAAACLPYDIQIHVQRPSPVHETSSSHRKLFQIGTGLDSKDGEQEVSLESIPVKNDVTVNTDVTAKESTSAEVSSVMAVNKDELAFSLSESICSNTITKVQEVDTQRVRPISSPATITCAERPNFDFVRKSLSVTNNLDEDGEPADLIICSRRSVGAISCTTQDTARPFGNSVGFHIAKEPIRRIRSTIEFCRQPLKSASFDIDDADVPAQPAAQRANFYGWRSRHTSGLETPMSTLDTSSVTSTGEAGSLLSCYIEVSEKY